MALHDPRRTSISSSKPHRCSCKRSSERCQVREYYADLDAALDAHQRQSLFNVIDLATGWKIDLIIRKSRAFSHEEFRRRQRVNLHNVSLFVASAEDRDHLKARMGELSAVTTTD